MLLVGDLLAEIKLQATDEHTSSVMLESVNQLDSFYKEFISDYSGEKSAGKDFLDYVKKQTKGNQVETIYGLSEHALYQINGLVEGTLEDTLRTAKETLKKKAKLEKKISEFDSYLSIDINDKELQEIYTKIKKAEQRVINDQVKLAKIEQQRSAVNARVISATSEFNKNVEIYLATEESRNSSDRITKYSNMALKIIKEYRVALQKKKVDLLAATITDCYLKLANKKNLIRKIEIDRKSVV